MGVLEIIALETVTANPDNAASSSSSSPPFPSPPLLPSHLPPSLIHTPPSLPPPLSHFSTLPLSSCFAVPSATTHCCLSIVEVDLRYIRLPPGITISSRVWSVGCTVERTREKGGLYLRCLVCELLSVSFRFYLDMKEKGITTLRTIVCAY